MRVIDCWTSGCLYHRAGRLDENEAKKSTEKAKTPWIEPVHASRGSIQCAWAMALYGALEIPRSSKLKGWWRVEVNTAAMASK
jgi:hypothetical protein